MGVIQTIYRNAVYHISSNATRLRSAMGETPTYATDIPSYEVYNRPPTAFADADEIVQALSGERLVEDARANAYTLAYYFGEEAQKEVIIGQQVLRVLEAFKHHNNSEEEFREYLVSKLSMTPDRARALSSLSPLIKQEIEKLPSTTETIGFGDRATEEQVPVDYAQLTPELKQAVTLFVGSTHNWGNQPESFAGTADIVSTVLENPKFIKLANIELRQPFGDFGAPQVGWIARDLGYKAPNKVHEAALAEQSIDRMLFVPSDAISLSPLGKLSESAAPFPVKDGQVPPFILPFAKDIQIANKMVMAISHGLTEKNVPLNEEDYKRILNLRYRLAYVSSGEMIAVLTQELEAAADDELKDRITEKIEQFKLKQEAIQKAVGPDIISDLDIDYSDENAVRMKCGELIADLNDEYREFLDVALNRGAIRPDQKFKDVEYIEKYLPHTSMELYLANKAELVTPEAEIHPFITKVATAIGLRPDILARESGALDWLKRNTQRKSGIQKTIFTLPDSNSRFEAGWRTIKHVSGQYSAEEALMMMIETKSYMTMRNKIKITGTQDEVAYLHAARDALNDNVMPMPEIVGERPNSAILARLKGEVEQTLTSLIDAGHIKPVRSIATAPIFS